MLVVRAARMGDLDGVLALARAAGPGMTTLKADRAALALRLDIAAASFAEQVAVAQRDYVFVMEDTGCGRVVGICAIKGAVGLDEPFYNYRMGTSVHSAAEIDVVARHELLHLSHELTGCAELCSLYLHPAYRRGINGKLLSKSRFLFIAQFPHLFPRQVFAEMRGFLRPDGSSPFWDGLGRHFFHMDFGRADDLCQPGAKGFIASLMPAHPIYVTLLPDAAREVIGQTHVDTAPARRLLEQEGMYAGSHIDIFDGGPVLQAAVHELRASRDSVLAALDGTCCARQDAAAPVMVCTTGITDFRVVAGPVSVASGRLRLPAVQRSVLACAAGDAVRALPLSAAR
jgi:arginine N-succinyltransferase